MNPQGIARNLSRARPRWLERIRSVFARRAERQTIVLPGVPRPIARQPLPKPTPFHLRRFAETPVARKAINTIKDRIAGMRWRIVPKAGSPAASADDPRIRALTFCFESPNPDDSFRSLTEQVIEDVLVGGWGAIEVQTTPDPSRPVFLWPVDGASILIYAGWSGEPAEPRYAQVAPWGQRIELRNDELVYIRLNPRTHTPFGLGRLEVAFETISWLLGAQEYAARLASNTVVQFALWLAEMPPSSYDKVISWWQNEIEGTGKVPIIANLPAKPEVLRFGEGSDRDLRLEWQKFLIRIIADAFDLPPLLLGLEQDINRATADALLDSAFRTAVVPTARLYAEHLTREVLGRALGWHDLEFVFDDLDALDQRALAELDEILLRSDVLLPDEVRARRGLPPLPGGWGALPFTERQRLIRAAELEPAAPPDRAAQT
jgi:phage portal protein BeeE